MLGGAIFVSVLGWAGIVRQTEASAQAETQPVAAPIAVVELPVPNASLQQTTQVQAIAPTTNQTSATTLRRVTRPVLRSRSSN
jgi:hypothetical protein